MLLIKHIALQQGKISEAEQSIRILYGKERVPEVMQDLAVGGQGSAELEAGWFDLFSSRYWKGTCENNASFCYSSGTIGFLLLDLEYFRAL